MQPGRGGGEAFRGGESVGDLASKGALGRHVPDENRWCVSNRHGKPKSADLAVQAVALATQAASGAFPCGELSTSQKKMSQP